MNKSVTTKSNLLTLQNTNKTRETILKNFSRRVKTQSKFHGYMQKSQLATINFIAPNLLETYMLAYQDYIIRQSKPEVLIYNSDSSFNCIKKTFIYTYNLFNGDLDFRNSNYLMKQNRTIKQKSYKEVSLDKLVSTYTNFQDGHFEVLLLNLNKDQIVEVIDKFKNKDCYIHIVHVIANTSKPYVLNFNKKVETMDYDDQLLNGFYACDIIKEGDELPYYIKEVIDLGQVSIVFGSFDIKYPTKPYKYVRQQVDELDDFSDVITFEKQQYVVRYQTDGIGSMSIAVLNEPIDVVTIHLSIYNYILSAVKKLHLEQQISSYAELYKIISTYFETYGIQYSEKQTKLIIEKMLSDEKQLSFKDRNVKEFKLMRNIQFGVCWSQKMEDEASVPLDIKHIYQIKNTTIKIVFSEVLKDNLKQIQAINVKLDKIGRSHKEGTKIAEQLTDNDILKLLQNCGSSILKYTQQTNYLVEPKLIYEQYLKYVEYYQEAVKVGLFNPIVERGHVKSVTTKPCNLLLFVDFLNYYRYHFGVEVATRKVNKYDVILNLIKTLLISNIKIQLMPCTCVDHQHKLKKILPSTVYAHNKTIIYNQCLRTLFAAFKRQCKKVPSPDPKVLVDFHKYTENFFKMYIEPILKDFDYNYNQWFNHNDYNKQLALQFKKAKDISLDINGGKTQKKVVHSLFCKAEKQEDGGKNRAIAAIDDSIKYIMGPVCWFLEYFFNEKLDGYCGRKNAEDISKKLSTLNTLGYDLIIQGDGSGFDQTQNADLKYIDYLIYKYLYDHDKIHHVNPKLFFNVACTPIKVMSGEIIGRNRVKLASAEMIGTVFSGSSDTTLMNTVRNILYNKYTLSKCGLDEKLMCKGDDFVIFIRTKLSQSDVENIYYKVWVPKTDTKKQENIRNFGIGQIMKKISVVHISKLEFCSSIVYYNKEKNFFLFARQPDRMVRFFIWSRKATYLDPPTLKQYLLDQAEALQASGLSELPFYEIFYKAFMQQANNIDGEPLRLASGQSKKILELNPDIDGHNHLVQKTSEDKYQQFNINDDEYRSYMHARMFRDVNSDFRNLIKQNINREIVEKFLLETYHWTVSDIKKYEKILMTKNVSTIMHDVSFIQQSVFN
jgi:hypothetical protein